MKARTGSAKHVALSDYITIDRDILGGEPVFRGTRVPVASLFEHLESDCSLEEFLARIFHSCVRATWVEQATRLFRSATRRPEGRGQTVYFREYFVENVRRDLPPGQWPGGTGKLPCHRSTMKYPG